MKKLITLVTFLLMIGVLRVTAIAAQLQIDPSQVAVSAFLTLAGLVFHARLVSNAIDRIQQKFN